MLADTDARPITGFLLRTDGLLWLLGKGERVVVTEHNHGQLVSRIASGDARAEQELVNQFSRGVMFILRKRSGDEDLAQDIHQDTFQVVLQKARNGDIGEPDKIKAYILSVARNLLIEHYRKTTRRKTDPDTETVIRAESTAMSPFEHASNSELAQYVRTVVSELTQKRDRSLLRMLYFENDNKNRICAELKLTSQQFDRVKNRALSRLRELALTGGRRQH